MRTRAFLFIYPEHIYNAHTVVGVGKVLISNVGVEIVAAGGADYDERTNATA